MNGSRIRHDVARNQAQCGCLATAGRAEQRDEGIVADLHIEAAHRRAISLAAIGFRDVFDRDPGHQDATPTLSSRPPTLPASQIAAPMIAMLIMARAATGSV